MYFFIFCVMVIFTSWKTRYEISWWHIWKYLLVFRRFGSCFVRINVRDTYFRCMLYNTNFINLFGCNRSFICICVFSCCVPCSFRILCIFSIILLSITNFMKSEFVLLRVIFICFMFLLGSLTCFIRSNVTYFIATTTLTEFFIFNKYLL